MDYEDKIYLWLTKTLKPGNYTLITDLTREPEKFIQAVKNCIDYWGCKYIEFSNDFKSIRKLEQIIIKKQNENEPKN